MRTEKPTVRNKHKATSSMRLFRHLLLVIFISLPMTTSDLAADCELHEALSRATSSDGKWVAIFFDNVCGGGFVTTSFSSVELIRPNDMNLTNPSDGRTVFAMEDLVDPKIAAVTWVGPRNLQLTIPNDAWIDEQESTFADVTISYRHVPDDAIGRECLNRLRVLLRSLSIDELQRQPTRDEYIARCRSEGGLKPLPQ